jgi:hypothetical protein
MCKKACKAKNDLEFFMENIAGAMSKIEDGLHF